MDITSKEAISFNLFYLMEFLNITLKKIEGKIADSHFKLLKSISSYLVKEETIVEGLEKIAKYQQTNDLAIFLFDMIERANDYGPKIVYNTLPDLAEDFLNLYSLMVEDDDCVKTLQKVVDTFQTKFGNIEKDKQLDDFVDMAQATKEDTVTQEKTEDISFQEFYFAELLKKVAKNIGEDEEAKDILKVCGVLVNINDIKEEYSDAIKSLASSIQPILPNNDNPFPELYQEIDMHAVKLATVVSDFQKNEKSEFDTVLNSGEVLPLTIEKKEVEEIQSVDVKEPEVKSDIDNLLVQYFKSEVEDSFRDLKAHLEKDLSELNSLENIQHLVKKFKSLKEVSMIHGYSGLEYIAQLLSAQFSDLKNSANGLSEESIANLTDIYSDLLAVENYADKNIGQKYVDAIKEKIKLLTSTFKPIESAIDSKPDDVEEIVSEEAAEALIGIDNHDEIELIIQAFFKVISKKISTYHTKLDSKETQLALSETLELVDSNGPVFHKDLVEKITLPIRDVYKQEALSSENINVLESVWQKLSETPLSKIDFDLLNKSINELKQEEQVSLIGFEDSKIQDAFIETASKEWENQKENLRNALTKGDDNQAISNYVGGLGNNLEMLGYSNYLPFIDFVREKINKSKETAFDDEVALEIENAFKLFFDRINHHGKNGDCNDILAVLNDIIEQPEAPVKAAEEIKVTEKGESPLTEDLNVIEEKEAEQAEEKTEPVVEQETDIIKEDEDDDLSLFKNEAQEHLKAIHENLDAFSLSKEREKLISIENACHAIRSSAHFLNLKDISKFAASIEDVAELFGKSEFKIPEGLDASLRIGITTLENLISDPATEFAENLELLEALLDNVAIEDVGTQGEDQFGFDKSDTDQEKQKKKVEEKPLFAEGAEEDEELLEIFSEESITFLANISDSNKTLVDNPDNEEALETMSYAAHSLKSAAKMLGFREISQITDSLEQVTNSIISADISHSPELSQKITDAVHILEQLSKGESLAADKVSGIIYDLEVDNWIAKGELETSEPAEEELPESMVNIFIEEAREIISGLNDDYLELEKMPESEMVLTNILRRIHTLKGSAYISKYKLIGDLAHKMEDYFDLYTQKESSVKNEMVDIAFLSLDLTTEMVDSIAEKGTEKIEQFTTRIAEIDNKIFTFQNFGETPFPVLDTKELPAKPTEQPSQKKKPEEENIIKISTDYMDKLVDMASELMINQTQLGAHLHSLKDILSDIEGEKKQIHGAENILEDAIEFGVLSGQDSADENVDKKDEIRKMSDNIKDVVRAVNMIHGDLNKLSEGFEQNIGRLSSISKLLHSDMLKTRMVPVDNLFNRYPRAVRDLAQKQKKKVNLIIEDNNTEMDRAMVEGLAEPILHIIRNAIDHGLETPEERQKRDKSESGTLLLKARQEKNQIVIDITDDGRGIDVENVRKKIIEKELSEKAQVDKMSEAEILDYIFVAGFSTRDEATDLSGRGIGLDSVSAQIQKLKGNIRIKTEQGKGASFSLRVPLTLVISQALMVKIDMQSVAIPVIAVQETIEFKASDIINEGEKNYIRVRGRLLPYTYLGDILKFGSDDSDTKREQQMAVVIYDAGVSMALGIDELVGRQEVVIKSLGSHLQNVDYISGGTILANGDVALILDFALVIRTIEMHFFGKLADRPTSKKVLPKQKPAAKKKSEKAVKRKAVKDSVIKDENKSTIKVKKRSIQSRKPKVIIVDDSNSVRNFVGSILERNGFLTIKSTNGADALEKMKTEKVDLMITDLEMPKMHGFDLISNIREQKKHDSLPIIILTGRAGMKHRQTGEELGANAFIVKPFKEKDLLQSLSEFIKTTEK